MTDPLIRLHDILERIDLALEFMDGLSWEQFLDDRKTQEAVLRQIQVIGQACGQIPPPLREAYPKVPWRLAIDMRNLVTHEYWRVDTRIVWETAQGELPRLRKLIEAVMTAEQESGASPD